jgi:hypothetical protein
MHRASHTLARFAPPSTTLAVTGLSTVDAGTPVTATASLTDNGVVPVAHVRLGLLPRPAGP